MFVLNYESTATKIHLFEKKLLLLKHDVGFGTINTRTEDAEELSLKVLCAEDGC